MIEIYKSVVDVVVTPYTAKSKMVTDETGLWASMKKYGVEPGFSMKMRVEQEGGVPVVFLVQRVRQIPIAPAAFSLPEGYKRVKGTREAQP